LSGLNIKIKTGYFLGEKNEFERICFT
jgi:hypothetical protein